MPDSDLAKKIIAAAKLYVGSIEDLKYVPYLENWLEAGDFELKQLPVKKSNYEREGPKYATLESQILPDRKDALD
jgi:hypothetical protein